MVAATHAHVDRALGVLAPTAPDLARLEHAQQLRLQRERQLADLVEEQRAAVGRPRTAPARSATAPVNAPRTWPNSSLSIRFSAMRAAVDDDERPVGARGGARGCARATSSLPVPVSPWMSTVASVGATRSSMRVDAGASRRSRRAARRSARARDSSIGTGSSPSSKRSSWRRARACAGRELGVADAHAVDERAVRAAEVDDADAVGARPRARSGGARRWDRSGASQVAAVPMRTTPGSSRRARPQSGPSITCRSIAAEATVGGRESRLVMTSSPAISSVLHHAGHPRVRQRARARATRAKRSSDVPLGRRLEEAPRDDGDEVAAELEVALQHREEGFESVWWAMTFVSVRASYDRGDLSERVQIPEDEARSDGHGRPSAALQRTRPYSRRTRRCGSPTYAQ